MPEGDLIAIRMRLTGGEQVAAEAKAANAEIASTGAAAKKASAETRAASKSASTAAASSSAKLAKTATSLKSVGRGLTKYVSLPIAGVGVAAGYMALDFDRSMRNVNSIAQLPERQFESLKHQVLDLAGPTAQAPKTLAEGLYDLVSSGFDAKESIVILRRSALAASAGLTTTEVSTKAVAAALNAYHLPAHKAGLVSDQLFETVNRGVLTFDELSKSVGDVLPFAAQLHVNLGEVGAALSTMTKEGLSSAEAVTRSKNVLVTLIKPGKELSTTLEGIGMSGAELVQKKGLQGALETIVGTTDGTKEAVAALFPNIRAMGGVLALTGINARSASEDVAAFRDVSGATNRVLKEQEKSFGFKIQRAWAELQKTLVEMGEDLLPVVVPFVLELAHAGASAAHFFAELPDPLQKVALGLAGMAALAGPTLLMAGSVLNLAKNLGLLSTVSGGGMLSGRGSSLKGALGRGAIGIGGTIAAQAAGDAVGGDFGSWISSAGTGAAIGGSVGGAPGALVGGAAGGVAAAYSKISGELKQVSFEQRRLVGSGKDVVNLMADQRNAAAGLVASDHRVQLATRRRRASTEAMKSAQRHLTAVVSEYGAKSRPAVRAEARLTSLTDQHRRAIRRLQSAERLRGVALSAYKTVTNSTILAERHRINVLTQLRTRQERLFQSAKQANPQSKKTLELAGKLGTTQGKLEKATKQQGETLRDAAAKGGASYAKFLQHANQESLRAGGGLKALNARAERLTTTLKGLAELEVTVPHISQTPRTGGGRHGHNAAGTNWWHGGLSLVGERGAELIDLPRGSRVFSAPRTREMMEPRSAAAAAAYRGSGGDTRYLVAAPVKIGRKVVAEAVVEAEEDAKARL